MRGGPTPGPAGAEEGEPWSQRCPRPGWPQMGTEPSADDPLRPPRAPTAELTRGSDAGSRRAPRSLPWPLLSGTGTAQGHQKTQRYLPAVWWLTSVSPCDLTWSLATTSRLRGLSPGPPSTGASPRLTQGQSSGATARAAPCCLGGHGLRPRQPQRGGGPGPRGSREGPGQVSCLRAGYAGPRAPGPPLPPSHPCASSQQGLREPPAQAHTHPPPPAPVEADLIKVVPEPKTDNTGQRPPHLQPIS